MVQRSRPPRLEKRCPLPTTHTRLHQLHTQWHRTAEDYGEPDDFLTSLNAALVSLRSLPDVLEKEKRRIPNFDAWYATHDAAFRVDPLLQWLVKARNHVVHHGDLALHSRARVRVLVSGQQLPEIDIDVPPLLDQHEIASLIADRVTPRVRERGVLAVERRWVAADLPDEELLEVLAHGFGRLADVVADAHRQAGVVMRTFGDEAHARRPQCREHLGGRLSCMVAHASRRTAYIHLARDRSIVTEPRERRVRREEFDDFDPGFAFPEDALERDPDETIVQAGERMVSFARALMTHTGVHLPMAMIHEGRELPPVVVNLHASDTQEQAMMIESLVEDIERSGAEGLVFISELHHGDGPTSELVVAAVADDGSHRVWHSPFERTARRGVRLGDVVVDERLPAFLNPIQRALVKVGTARRRA